MLFCSACISASERTIVVSFVYPNLPSATLRIASTAIVFLRVTATEIVLRSSDTVIACSFNVSSLRFTTKPTLSDVSAYGSKQRYLLRECFWLIVITEEWTMRKTPKSPGEKIVKDIKRATRKHYSSEEKIRIVLDGLRGEDSIAELCRREGIAQGIYYKWSKDFMEAGKKRLAGDTARAANTDEVKELRREAKDLKEVVAEQTLELRLLKKSMYGGGGDHE